MKNVDVKMDSKIKMMTHYFPVIKISTNVNLDSTVVSAAAKMESVTSHVTVQKDSNKEKEKNSVELARKKGFDHLVHFSLVIKISTNVKNLLLTVATEFVEIRSEASTVIVIKDFLTS